MSDSGVDCLTCDVDADRTGTQGELSPSGELLVFTDSGTGPISNLYVLHLPSGQIHLLDDGVNGPHWSPEGDGIFFVSTRDGSNDIWFLEVDPNDGTKVGSSLRITSGLGIENFALSPDGRRMLAVKSIGLTNLWSFPTGLDRVRDLSVGKQLTRGQFSDDHVSLSPDEKTAFFISDRRGSLDTWKLSLDSLELARLTFSPGTEWMPRASPDGRWLAYTGELEDGGRIRLMRSEGGDPQPVDPTFDQQFEWTGLPDWSPDGTRLAFAFRPVGEEQGIGTLRVHPDDGTVEDIKLFRVPGSTPEWPVWSPDGRHLAYEVRPGAGWMEIWIVDADGTNARALASDPNMSIRYPQWQSDPLYLYYRQTVSGRIWRLPMDASGDPAGIPEVWLELPGEIRPTQRGYVVGKEQAIVAVAEYTYDIWLVEF